MSSSRSAAPAAATCTLSTAGSPGSYQPLPVVLGHENAGWVHAVGPAVEHLAVGNLIDTRADLEDLVMLAAQGKVVPDSTRYLLEAANDAIGDLRHGRIRGCAILSPG